MRELKAAPKHRLSLAVAACLGGLSMAAVGAIASSRRLPLEQEGDPSVVSALRQAVPRRVETTGVVVPAVPEPLAPSGAATRRPPSSQPRLRTAVRGHLAEELELLDQARSAIEQKNYAEALDHLDAHARDFQNGQLAEEREAIRVQALAEMGRHEEALLVARSFASHFPHSILRPVVEKLSAASP